MWVRSVGNSWRTGADALPTYNSIISNAFVNNLYANVAGPGHFNDADMMEIGNGNPGLTLAEVCACARAASVSVRHPACRLLCCNSNFRKFMHR